MSKCPLYGKCTIDASLLASVGSEDRGSERYKYEYVMCKGKGNPPDQWSNCMKYDPIEAAAFSSGEPKQVKVPTTEKIQNIKICGTLGIIIGLIASLFLYIDIIVSNNFLLAFGGILLFISAGGWIGIGIPNLGYTVFSPFEVGCLGMVLYPLLLAFYVIIAAPLESLNNWQNYKKEVEPNMNK